MPLVFGFLNYLVLLFQRLAESTITLELISSIMHNFVLVTRSIVLFYNKNIDYQASLTETRFCVFPQKDAAPPRKPTHGIIYVASSYPAWQHATLNILKEMYNQLGGNFPDNRDIMNRMKQVPEVKSAMKKLMPFVQHVKVPQAETSSLRCFKNTINEMK